MTHGPARPGVGRVLVVLARAARLVAAVVAGVLVIKNINGASSKSTIRRGSSGRRAEHEPRAAGPRRWPRSTRAP